jgi:hypothetical protein
MLLALKNFQKSNNVRVSYFLEKVNFLKDFPFTEIVLHERLFDRFYCYLFASQNVHAESYFAKSALAD